MFTGNIFGYNLISRGMSNIRYQSLIINFKMNNEYEIFLEGRKILV